MATKTYEIAGFDGGLVTAIDESLLHPSMSPALLNVDILASGSIRRRYGYANTSATSLPNLPVRAMTRLYRDDGTNHWVAAVGATVWSKQDSVHDRPLARKEFSTSNISGTASVVTDASFSGGSALYCDSGGGITATIPYSNYAKVYFGQSITASVKVDSGSWSSVTATSFWKPSLTATAHTLYVKPTATNDKSLKLTTHASTATDYAWARADRTSMPTVTRSVTLSFYDTGEAGSSAYAEFTVGSGVYLIGLRQRSSATKYTISMSDSTTPLATVTADRTTGWHTVTAELYEIQGDHGPKTRVRFYIDGGSALYSPGSGSLTLISLTSHALKSQPAKSNYFDNLIVDGTLLDDFDATTGWTFVYSGGTGTAEVSTTHSVASYKPFTIDCVDSSCQSVGWHAHSANLSASSNLIQFAGAADVVYFNTPYDSVQSFDGSTVATVATSPAGGFLIDHKLRLWTAGRADNPSLMEYTSLAATYSSEFSKWSGGDAGAMRLVADGSGNHCSGLVEFDNRIFYFSRSNVYALTAAGAPENWVAQTLPGKAGCIAPRSIATSANALLFLSADGVRGYGAISGVNTSDGSGFFLLSRDIAPTLNAFTEAEKSAACGAFYKGRYFLAIGDKVLVADMEKRNKAQQPPWTVYDYSGLGTIHSLYVTRGDEYGLYAGGDGFIYQLDIGETDNGLPISMSYSTPPLAVSGYAGIKHFSRVYVRADSETSQPLTITPYTDDVASSGATLTVSPNTAVQPLRVPLTARGRSIKVVLSSDGASQPLSISALTFVFVPPRLR